MIFFRLSLPERLSIFDRVVSIEPIPSLLQKRRSSSSVCKSTPAKFKGFFGCRCKILNHPNCEWLKLYHIFSFCKYHANIG
jgi:hypothetical protein